MQRERDAAREREEAFGARLLQLQAVGPFTPSLVSSFPPTPPPTPNSTSPRPCPPVSLLRDKTFERVLQHQFVSLRSSGFFTMFALASDAAHA